MEEEYRTFDAVVTEKGNSLSVTVPMPVCMILNLKKDDLVQVKIKKEKGSKS